MRFAYRHYEGDLPRPALKVRVRGAGECVLWGILDTGSEECVLPYNASRWIRPRWTGRTGALVDYAGRPHLVDYAIVRFRVRIKDRSLDWPATVGFDRSRDAEALWGYAGFFEHFRITFDGPQNHFTMRIAAGLPPGFTSRPLPRRRPGGDVIDPHDQDP